MKPLTTKKAAAARAHFLALVQHTDDLFAGRITHAEHAARNDATWRAIERDGLADEVSACWCEWRRAGAPSATVMATAVNPSTN